MALIVCSDCGRSVSSKAPHCIHCGCPISAQRDVDSVAPAAAAPPTPVVEVAAPVPPSPPTAAPAAIDDEVVPIAHLDAIPFEVIAGFLQKRKDPRVRAVRYLAQEIEFSGSFLSLVRARVQGTGLQLGAEVKWRWYVLTALIPWAVLKAMIEAGQGRLGGIGTIVLMAALFAASYGLWHALGLGGAARRSVRQALLLALKDRAPLDAEHHSLREAVARRHAQMGLTKPPGT